MTKTALITGISGQDGSFLAELLLKNGYEVHGIVQRVELEDAERYLWRILPILPDLKLHTASIESYPSMFRVLDAVHPSECYHLAAQSFVSYTVDDEFSTLNTNINGTHYLLSGIKEATPGCRFYFAGSSEMFGRAETSPQNESTPFHPRSAYGISKVTGYYLTRNYRESYGLFTCNGILYNHESERRGSEFVTRKISGGVARIKLGLKTELRLGNLEAHRDWGYSPDYVEAMWLMLQQAEPDDYVVATGETHRVRDFVEIAFASVGLDWQKYVVIDENLFRPAETVTLVGDARKAKKKLGWAPKVRFEELVERMVRADLELLAK